MSWTDERVEKLKSMWNDGKSASQIAKELGNVTRNAVIGKVHRLGLSNRAAAAAPAKTPEKKAAPARDAATKPAAAAETPTEKPATEAASERPAAAPTPVINRRPVITAGQPLPPQPSANEISPEALANVREVEKKAMRLNLLDLTERTCKWPIGDPATEDFWFCGLPCQTGKPYCEAHVSVAFQPMTSRRDRRASR